VLAAVLLAVSCKIDRNVPKPAGCADCRAPDRCEGAVCVRAGPPDTDQDGGGDLDASPEAGAGDADAATSCEDGDSQPCFDGPGSAVEHTPCRPGVRTCEDGRFGVCTNQILPAGERCNDVDDDCDGNIDEAFDTASDPAHCGACNQACATGQQCCSGACADVDSDTDHCGGCGNRCDDADQCCSGLCVDAQSDSEHCGAGCVACRQGQDCCSGVCRDLGSFQHCGACGNACDPDTQLCCEGTCSTVAACGS
jgi:hypothetical protein